jgi:hypothetical protein
MGLFFRKSINFGLFRINLSKSGIGVSAGVKGARISTGSRGTYINLGRNGVYYRQKMNSAWKNTHTDPANENTYQADSPSGVKNFGNDEMIDSSKESTLERINSQAEKTIFTPFAVIVAVVWVIVVFGLLTNASSSPNNDNEKLILSLITLLTLPGSISLVWLTYRYDQHRRTVPLIYEIDDPARKDFLRISQACEAISKSYQIWCMSHQETHWGIAQISKKLPRYISTNIDVWSINSPRLILSFFPDQLLVRINEKYESIAYQDLTFHFHPSSPTVLSGNPPPDAEVVNRIWLYSRKDGGPDLRYKHNPLLPVVRYGQAVLTHRNGNRICLQTTSSQAAKYFCALMGDDGQQARSQTNSRQQNSNRAETRKPTVNKTAYNILGVKETATKEEVVAAYRNLVKMNHPDKVATLDPEFRTLAEKRMKEINAAYRTLIKRYE